MRKAVVLYGVSEETLHLVPLLEANPELEIAAVVDPNLDDAREMIARMGTSIAERLLPRLTAVVDPVLEHGAVHAVVDAGTGPAFAEVHPDVAARGVQIVSPLTARLLWGYGASAPDRKGELLQALHEVVESVNLTVDPEELFRRMLEIALSVTGADGGSLMLLDEERGELFIRVALGVERELWPKIRLRLGEGIAGRVAADARPLKLRGKADQQGFQIVRERFDVESALCVPLVHKGRVLGVLNLHHATRPDAFADEDLAFAEQLGRLDAEIIARAQEHEQLRSQAARYNAVQEVQGILSGRTPLHERLETLCHKVAARVGGGIATVYLFDPDERELRLAATSLTGGGFGGDYRIALGQGVDGGVAQSGEAVFLPGPAGALAYAALPLLDASELVGVLSVQTGDDPAGADGLHRDGAIREALLEIAAASADEVAQFGRESRMSSRATKIGAINEAGIRLVSAQDPDEVARLATSSAALTFEADHVVLRLQDAETRRYVIKSYYGSASGRLEEALFKLDKQVCVDAIKRRGPLILRDPERSSDYEEVGSGVRSLMAAPLKRDGRVIGTLAIYDKMAADQFYPGVFNEDDLEIFSTYATYVERAVESARVRAQGRRHRRFDEDTGLPNTAYLGQRIDQEITRASGRAGALALVTCQIENAAKIRRGSDQNRVDRVVIRTAEVLRTHLRDFDVLGRTGETEFTALLPDPGPQPEERVAKLARAIADDVAKDDPLNDPVRVGLCFGYAVYPAEGQDRESLGERARLARIRML